MKLYGVSMVRNESDIIESWVRYHLQFLDGLLVVDHASVDSTPEILRRLRDEGLSLETTRLDRSEFDQDRIITGLARDAARDGADWVFPLDGDEFLNVRDSDPRRILLACDRDAPLSLPWQTYVPRSDQDPLDPAPLRRIQWRLKEETRRFDKVAVPCDMLANSAIRVSLGSHALLDGDSRIRSARGPSHWSIAHFPVRSAEQLARKAFAGWLSILSHPGRGPRTSYQWRNWFHFLLEHDLSELDPGELAIKYLHESGDTESEAKLVHDPLPSHLCTFNLRYRADESTAPLKALALAAESQARELAEFRRRAS